LRLWIESAHQSLTKAGAKVYGDAVRTLQTEEQFTAVLVSGPEGDGEEKEKTTAIADKAASLLEQGTPLEKVVKVLLAALPAGEHTPFAILQVKTSEVSEDLRGLQAHLIECDAPPLFLTRAGRLILLPVVEEESQGHLIRECSFTVQDGDHIAMVSEGYVRAHLSLPLQGGRPGRGAWHWQDIAVSIRRWTETGCDAEQLLGALIRTYHRLAEEPALSEAKGEPRQDVTVIAMHVRPLRSATVWSGPPADPALDQVALEKLMAEPGMRILCGDTTAEIAARLLGAELELEPRPEDGWAEVPPTSRLEGVNLVTEGLVTLGKAHEQLARAKRVQDLPRETDGATRLAQMLLTADRIHFIVGLAVNPQQAADAAATIPLRRIVIDDLVCALKAHGKVVSVEHF
jgi:hypothetical protein